MFTNPALWRLITPSVTNLGDIFRNRIRIKSTIRIRPNPRDTIPCIHIPTGTKYKIKITAKVIMANINIWTTGIILLLFYSLINSRTRIRFPSTDMTLISVPFSMNSPSLTTNTR